MKDIEKEQVVKPMPEIEIKAILPDDDIYINYRRYTLETSNMQFHK